MKIKIFQDHVISIDGVEKVWAWECPHRGCDILRKNYGNAVYWENALRMARQHLDWHLKSPLKGR